MRGRGDLGTVRCLPLALAILAGLLASCSARSGLILVDSALPVLDPGAARAYSTFRAAGIRWTVREYPARTGDSVFEEFATRPPDFVLLTPLLASELQSVREAFPEARILGTGIPEGGRTVSAVWDPAPAAREAGIRAASFLKDRGEELPEPPEAVILVSPGAGSSAEAAEAFREGLDAVRPGTPVRILELSGPEGQADSLFRQLGGPGAKAILLDAGAAGFRAARILVSPPSRSDPPPGPRFTVLRSSLTPPENLGTNLVLLRDARTLFRAFRSALERGKTGPIPVPETMESASRRR